MKKRILIGSLIAVILLVLAGCGEKDTYRNPEDSATESTAVSGKEEPGKGDTDKEDAGGENADGEDAGAYQLAAGASSEYELYKTVLGYLNNGFRSDDIKAVYDPALTMAFYLKCEEDEGIFTRGMEYDETCNLIARLRTKAARMDVPYDEDGELEEDLIDFDAFEGEFPEGMRGQIEQNRSDFEDFIVNIFYMASDFSLDGKNPFYTDQTEWEVKSEGEYEVQEYHSDDLNDNFPKVYEISLGTYISYEATEMWFYCTQLEGRYYLLDFGYAVSGIGG